MCRWKDFPNATVSKECLEPALGTAGAMSVQQQLLGVQYSTSRAKYTAMLCALHHYLISGTPSAEHLEVAVVPPAQQQQRVGVLHLVLCPNFRAMQFPQESKHNAEHRTPRESASFGGRWWCATPAAAAAAAAGTWHSLPRRRARSV